MAPPEKNTCEQFQFYLFDVLLTRAIESKLVYIPTHSELKSEQPKNEKRKEQISKKIKNNTRKQCPTIVLWSS